MTEPTAETSERWLTAGVRGIGAASFLADVGHEIPTARPSTNAHHARLTSPSNTAISVWPLADPLLDWEVLT